MILPLLSLLLCRVAFVAQRPIAIKLSRGRSVVYASVRTCVGRSVQCIMENGGSDPDAVWHHRSNGFRDEAGSGVCDRSTRRGTFGGEFRARHCNQWRLYDGRVQQRRDAALFPNYFEQTCYYYYVPLPVSTIARAS